MLPGSIVPDWVRRSRRFRRTMLLALGAVALVPPSGVAAQARPEWGQYGAEDLRDAIARRADSDLRAFYASRTNRPLWIDDSGRLTPAADILLRQVETAQFDGLKPKKFKPGDLARALDRAEQGSPDALARAEIALSRTLANYVKAMRAAPHAPMSYESEALSPVVPTTAAALAAAASADSLDNYVQSMGWMHPLYAPLREAIGAGNFSDEQRDQIWLNLERVRALPAYASGRHVLIDAASARLWMYDNGRMVDSMKVVVGKPATQTPTMAGFIRYAIVNPYWNLPDDLMPSRITDHVLRSGPGYVAANRYQILPSWDEGAPVLDPRKVDWQAVAAGTQTIRARQLPGPGNFMGSVKFMFPNPQGIYLHDTPERDLLAKDARQFSNGCVRLEDAQRLGRWLMGKPLPRNLRAPEQRIELPEVVPVYITYLTAMPENGRIAFRDDVYARDRTQLAMSGTNTNAR
ncbi:MAG TPA: L,D-transpeptidase family protein [Novosphingobium sp.]|nr:L,D-transpeptidase family protein [Novosphingobium sp.]